ncbi:GNAT superfamily N-acetyltransferase [Kibdelosporangium banguiense]|uniref:GNAT superfamily N-acetyltransferase n=1 Tax=Kibdelosporangium banguiense TaxID=1365924 RepID=A0ABS4TMQ8_9PSEU|nr:GNAT family N-acetyltransferase [Kibdelosporangium banguiense]MBP2325696.1 GNAT superfamily N-acetyltransferase [Kibdelosporangium banguiense]
MRDVEIRPAQPADLAALVDAFADEDLFTDRLNRQKDGRGELLTAWIEDVLIGSVYLRFEAADEHDVRERLPGVPLLHRIVVVPEHRNQGVGTKLMSAAEKRLAKYGYDQVALAVRTDNVRARIWYERLGYAKWPHPTVECLYELKLPDGSRKTWPETCDMLVRTLRDNNA